MSLFLIVFDRVEGELRDLIRFEVRSQAEHRRIELEMQADEETEIVILEAASEQQLHETHARYFGSRGLEELAKAATVTAG